MSAVKRYSGCIATRVRSGSVVRFHAPALVLMYSSVSSEARKACRRRRSATSSLKNSSASAMSSAVPVNSSAGSCSMNFAKPVRLRSTRSSMPVPSSISCTWQAPRMKSPSPGGLLYHWPDGLKVWITHLVPTARPAVFVLAGGASAPAWRAASAFAAWPISRARASQSAMSVDCGCKVCARPKKTCA